MPEAVICLATKTPKGGHLAIMSRVDNCAARDQFVSDMTTVQLRRVAFLHALLFLYSL